MYLRLDAWTISLANKAISTSIAEREGTTSESTSTGAESSSTSRYESATRAESSTRAEASLLGSWVATEASTCECWQAHEWAHLNGIKKCHEFGKDGNKCETKLAPRCEQWTSKYGVYFLKPNLKGSLNKVCLLYSKYEQIERHLFKRDSAITPHF